jgi:hypothetical protein
MSMTWSLRVLTNSLAQRREVVRGHREHREVITWRGMTHLGFRLLSSSGEMAVKRPPWCDVREGIQVSAWEDFMPQLKGLVFGE